MQKEVKHILKILLFEIFLSRQRIGKKKKDCAVNVFLTALINSSLRPSLELSDVPQLKM